MDAFKTKFAKTILKKVLKKVGGELLPSGDVRAVGNMLSDNVIDTELDRVDSIPFADFQLLSSNELPDTLAGTQDWEYDLGLDHELDELAEDLFKAAQSLMPESTLENTRSIRSLSTTTKVDPDMLKTVMAIKEEYIIGAQTADPNTRGLFSAINIKYKIIKSVIDIGIAIYKRYRNGTFHGLHATAIEEILRRIYGDWIAETVWGMMKKDATDAFKNDGNEFGTYIVDKLATNPDVDVVLIGHSAGAVFISEFLLNDDTDRLYDIIFLAPAVTFTLFSEALQKNKIKKFRMLTMEDTFERKDDLVNSVPWLYPSSLLYFVSGICERDKNDKSVIDQAIVGMERYYMEGYKVPAARANEIKAVRSFIKSNADHVFWSETDQGAGKATKSKDHGYFDEEPKTLGSVKHMIQHGF